MKGARFLNESIVGREWRAAAPSGNREWAGWHSDRHPESERIDCLATTEAVTALCRLDDAFKWLLNLNAAGDFRVDWPNRFWQTALPADCEAGKNQLLLKVGRSIDRFRRSTELYTSASQRSRNEIGSHAFIFYGPPGTGKTHCQEIIAGDLGWPVVTITIGDFLGDGEDKVGSRAVEIFKRLSFLSNVCIVFDEFDEMVTVRTPRDELRPGSPLLCAAMLPLLSALRVQANRQCCALSFTTNHIENIDQAAKRAGRVDETVLVMYPDFSSRLLVALRALIDVGGERKQKNPAWSDLTTLAMDTAICAWPDVTGYIRHVIRFGLEGRDRPRAAVDLEQVREESVAVLRGLFDSIGKPILNTWLSKDENWRRVYQGLDDHRRGRRKKVKGVKATVAGQQTDVIEVGDGGFRAILPTNRILPERIKVDLPRFSLQARVVWQNQSGKCFGAEVIQVDGAWQEYVKGRFSDRKRLS